MYSFILGIYAQCTSIISNFVVCEYNDNKGFSISIISCNKCMTMKLRIVWWLRSAEAGAQYTALGGEEKREKVFLC